jgi:hypothetical protein
MNKAKDISDTLGGLAVLLGFLMALVIIGWGWYAIISGIIAGLFGASIYFMAGLHLIITLFVISELFKMFSL